MTTDEKVLQVREWTQKNRDVRYAVASVQRTHGAAGIAELAEKHPEAFESMYEGLVDLLDEEPFGDG